MHDKQHWDGAIKFLSENLTQKIELNEKTLKEMIGSRVATNTRN